jgi:tetratricopeptide (TPR) repeat protein
LEFKGYHFYGVRKTRKAIKCYDKAIEINPDFDLPWENKGLYYLEIGESEKALKCFEQAIKINPEEAEYWYEKGKALSFENTDEAIKCFDHAIKINPEKPDYWYEKGNALLLEDPDKVIGCSDEVLKLYPEHVGALGLKGLGLYVKGELRKALDCYNKILTIKSYDAYILEQKGIILIDLKKYDEALSAFNQILENDKNNREALYYKCDILFKQSNFKAALNCFKKVLENDPQNSLAWNDIGEVHVNLGENENAIECYDKALNLDPELYFTWVNKGYVYKIIKELEKSLQCFEKAIEIYPDYAEAWYQKGNVLRDLNQKKESLKAFIRFVEIVEKEKISEWELTANRVKEYINQQKTKGTKIIVSPRKKPWYWQWSTKPEFFLEANGDERKDLEPGTILPPGAWWTCHKDTRAGDLVFLYRAGKKDGKTYQDIKYLIMAKSDAYSVTIDEFAFEHGWKYGCDFEVLYKFKNPLTLNEIREEPFLDDWNAFRALFRLSAYKTEPRHWNKINEILAEKNPDYMKYLDEPVAKEKIRRIKSELELEESLYNHIEAFKKFGYDLEVIGRQVICKGEGGFMDILCRDKADGSYVVIELKIVPADQSAFAQISYYVAWVEKRMARGKPVKGIVISKGQDNRFKLAVNRDENIEHIQLSEVLSELGMKLT